MLRSGQPVSVFERDGDSFKFAKHALVVSIQASVEPREEVFARVAFFQEPEHPAISPVIFKTLKHIRSEDARLGREKYVWDYPVTGENFVTETNEATALTVHHDAQDLERRAALAAHEANRILCSALGDFTQPVGYEAPEWQMDSAVNGVLAIVKNPVVTPQQQHEAWMQAKVNDGWKHGPIKDPEKKEHPCLVSYDLLPFEQKLKDHLFGIVVRGVLGLKQMGIPLARPATPDAQAPEEPDGNAADTPEPQAEGDATQENPQPQS